MIHELTCIRCPLGCALRVETNEQGNAVSVTGNSCNLGEQYGKLEVTSPMRMVTSTVKLTGGVHPVIAVKTEKDVPKDKIFDVMDEIKKVSIQSPVNIGDVIIKNVADTGVDIIATMAG